MPDERLRHRRLGRVGRKQHDVTWQALLGQQSRRTATVSARGSVAPGCGFTITVLPVARLANRPG